jgi:hypothetical protein
VTTQETVGGLFLVFRNPFTNYLMAMYTSWGLRPERWLVYGVVVIGGVIALMLGGLGLLGAASLKT